MQSSENVVNRIIELDKKAEAIREKARQESNAILDEAQEIKAEQKKKTEDRIQKKIKKIESEAAEKRAEEIENVRNEYDASVKSVEGVPSEKIERAVEIVVSRIVGGV